MISSKSIVAFILLMSCKFFWRYSFQNISSAKEFGRSKKCDSSASLSSSNTVRSTSQVKSFHPRNRHNERYDFKLLIQSLPALSKHVIVNNYGDETVNWSDPVAVKLLNKALLIAYYGVESWDIPDTYLTPGVPGRVDYLHHMADLLGTDGSVSGPGGVNERDQTPGGIGIKALDIGCGASCIYPLLGVGEYKWQFVGSDISADALLCAQSIISGNKLNQQIETRLQPNPQQIFNGVIRSNEIFSFSMCNPPFHSSPEEALDASTRKWNNLHSAPASGGGRKATIKSPQQLNFAGSSDELYCQGGELGFIGNMIKESASGNVRNAVGWFSTLVSKQENMPVITRLVRDSSAKEFEVIELSQGNKKSRIVAWSYLDRQTRLKCRV